MVFFAVMRRIAGILLCVSIGFAAFGQNQVIGFYNVENLFDTINNDDVRDGEYTLDGSKEWSRLRYENKLNNMARVLNELGTEHNKKGLAAVGLCEVENSGVLEDLVQTGKLAKRKWSIVHGDSPDKRGIDNALLYNPKMFEVLSYDYHNAGVFRDGERVFTRDILLVQGVLGKADTVFILVNHWPSRYGGQEKSDPLRKQAAATNRRLVDSLLQRQPDAEILVMGDLNDDPKDESVKVVLGTTPVMNEAGSMLYNPFELIHEGDEGSLKYRGEWNLFDQIILSKGALNAGKWVYYKAEVYNRCYLLQQKGKYSGNPHRTFGGKTYLNGYSDHLPVMVVFKKAKN